MQCLPDAVVAQDCGEYCVARPLPAAAAAALACPHRQPRYPPPPSAAAAADDDVVVVDVVVVVVVVVVVDWSIQRCSHTAWEWSGTAHAPQVSM